ncbi:6-O-methylguanine DNA methyltransferase [Dendryphion nanum]|uniref:Methylated-DNA--protein-cysteine methyltransferase n=1 Tax=Dendryphion nanum TaxID=256645 RepID=A0A9P9DXJ4_9PLEO|nr:6-O-methylguanine DNA methyltransferase [Dendryphion nanum]
MSVTSFQTQVYTLVQQIPEGRITTYGALSKALNSSPQAIGGALRSNPFAPEIPCHRCIASSGFIGGYKGVWKEIPSSPNQDSKLKLLAEEGVRFDEHGHLIDKSRLWDDFNLDKL